MKNNKFTRKKKILALVIFVIAMSVTLIGGLGIYYVNNFSDYLFSKTELLENRKFEDTETLERIVLEDTQNIFQYASLSRIFETLDEDNRKISVYRARINNTEYDLSLSDLESIATLLMDGSDDYEEYESDDENDSYEEYMVTDVEAYSEESVSDDDLMYDDSSLEITDYVYVMDWSVERARDYFNSYGELYAEVYGGTTEEWIALSREEKEAIIKEENWEDYNKEASDNWPVRVALENTAEVLVYPDQSITLTYDYIRGDSTFERTDIISLYESGNAQLDMYYDYMNELDGEQTNLRFVVYEEASDFLETNDERILTGNMESTKNAEDNIRQMAKYVTYDNTTHKLDSNFTKIRVQDWGLGYWAQTISGLESGASFSVGLNTSYPVYDQYYRLSVGFARCRRILIAALPAVILGIIVSLVALIYLIASVGHREDYDGIWLDKFDQWPTETSALLIVGGILLFIWICGLLTQFFAVNFFSSGMIYILMQAISMIVSFIIGMIGFFSLVKRMKAGVLWDHSFLKKICNRAGNGIRNMAEQWPDSGKVAALILLYWILTIPTVFMIAIGIFSGRQALFVVSLLLLIAVQLGAAGMILWITICRRRILEGTQKISSGDLEYEIDASGMLGDDQKLVQEINSIGAGFQDAISTAVRSERMKADLITNVSHDIKTPLTSIINYVDLIKRENIQDETLKRYLDVLEQKSQRLKTLTEDLVEASRASSGNITLQLEKINFVELVRQACGEFSERFEERNLNPVIHLPDYPLYVVADGRRVWRILENLLQNANKYAMPGTRVYVSVEENEGYAEFVIKNISESALNISPEELTERFTRGDASRTAEGSGLGLSIAKNLTEIQNGVFELYLNGDLFQALVQFELAPEENPDTSSEI